ncbi:MAG TPA: hypothetical protein VGQ87_03845 [Patescibacteria group bacterium]|jgi:hypothetical protein|nr:hypothetical protein [Patescibacteria group bacterium]
MLAQLLSSKPKSKLVNLFLANSARSFSFTELRVSTGCPSVLLKKTIRELDKIGFLLVYEKRRIRYYQINKHFALYPELVGLLRKIKQVPQDLLAKNVSRAGDLRFAAITGVFAGRPRMDTDILLVGKIGPTKLKKFLKLAEKFAEAEVNYTVLSVSEFEYRKSMNDRFVKNILENDPVIVVDKIKRRNIAKLVYKL